MTVEPTPVTLETLRRFDRPGPRYTSYPTAVEFHDGVGTEAYVELLERAAAESDAPLSLYAHLPFCEHRCTFCGCHVVITRKEEVAERYLDYLEREIDLLADRLGDRRGIAQFHWGGGTPTHFSPAQLERLFAAFDRHFDLLPDAEVAIEVDPRVTTEEHLDLLARLGFNRLSMGVQDFTPEVQQVVERDQTYEETAALIEYARAIGFTEGINLDLIYGLPLQTVESFDANLDQVIGLQPDRVAVYSFAFVPWIKGHQRTMDTGLLPAPETKLDLYLRSLNRFLDAGYDAIGMDHFALPDDELAAAARAGTLHRNFMGYTVKPATDMLAVGISGIGDLQGAFVQNVKKLSTYYEHLDAGRLPVERGYVLDEDDLLRRWVITQLMCNFRVDKTAVADRFGVSFDDYFAADLGRLEEVIDAGFVTDASDRIEVSDTGRLFVRNVCMAFDRYLAEKLEGGKSIFSRTV
jgi:oxygen-independent coproporphyrinogen-3 oxidase